MPPQTTRVRRGKDPCSVADSGSWCPAARLAGRCCAAVRVGPRMSVTEAPPTVAVWPVDGRERPRTCPLRRRRTVPEGGLWDAGERLSLGEEGSATWCPTHRSGGTNRPQHSSPSSLSRVHNEPPLAVPQRRPRRL